jgi:hypothetical protein
VILRSNGNFGMMGQGKPPNALKTKGLEKEEEEEEETKIFKLNLLTRKHRT